MTLGVDDLEHLARCATEAARTAGDHVGRSRPQRTDHKPGVQSRAAQVVTDVDRHSQALILEVLEPTRERFGLGLLTEEQEDDRSRQTRDYFWCIDPLDGTLPFIESASGYGVSIALVARDGTPVIGAIFDPVEHTLYRAVRGMGILRDDRPWTPAPRPSGAPLTLFTDRSFIERRGHDRVVAALGPIARDLGLAGLEIQATAASVINACRVLNHPPACYFKLPRTQAGGGSLWDYAATACLFHEAGAVATDIHGNPLDLNRADSTFMNHRGILFASDVDIARQIQGLRTTLG